MVTETEKKERIKQANIRRQTSQSTVFYEKKLYMKEWKKKHPSYMKDYLKEWKIRNKEKQKRYREIWNKKHPN